MVAQLSQQAQLFGRYVDQEFVVEFSLLGPVLEGNRRKRDAKGKDRDPKLKEGQEREGSNMNEE